MLQNKFMFIGHVGKDAKTLANRQGETTTIAFSVCIDESYKNPNGEKVEKETWVNVYYPYKDNGNILKLLKKGVRVACEGAAYSKLFEYEDKATGRKEHGAELICRCQLSGVKILLYEDEIATLRAAKKAKEGATQNATQVAPIVSLNEDDDLPF
jgi:single-stranded DNA-binding protein